MILAHQVCRNEIKSAINILTICGTVKEKITVLHCNTEYPTPIYEVNLNAMLTIQKELNILKLKLKSKA